MKIYWLGEGCILVEDKKANILIDPFKEDQKIEKNVDVVLLSEEKLKFNHDLVFDWPGEYETKGVGVRGLSFDKKNGEKTTVFIMEMAGMRVCHLGRMDRVLDDSEVSQLGDIDVLTIPVGGKDVLDAKSAHKIIESVDPRMVIPIHFSLPGDEGGYAPIDDFKREMGLKEDYESQKSVEVKNMPEDQTLIVILEK